MSNVVLKVEKQVFADGNETFHVTEYRDEIGHNVWGSFTSLNEAKEELKGIKTRLLGETIVNTETVYEEEL